MEDNSENCLLLIQKLYAEKRINESQRDALKDMLFDEDAILLSFFSRFSEPDEEEDLKTEVIKYASNGNFGGKMPMEEQNTTGESLDDISSPMDSGIGMKKKRLAAIQKASKEQEKPKQAVSLGIADCDLGASPQMSKGLIFNKKTGSGGMRSSPIQSALHFQLGKRQ